MQSSFGSCEPNIQPSAQSITHEIESTQNVYCTAKLRTVIKPSITSHPTLTNMGTPHNYGDIHSMKRKNASPEKEKIYSWPNLAKTKPA